MTGLTPEQRRILREALPGLSKDDHTALVTALNEAMPSLLERDMVYGASRRERRAFMVAGGAVLAAIGGIVIGLWGMTTSETSAFLTIVDKDTGIAERAVTVEHAPVEFSEAVERALTSRYVRDRETYDVDDNEPRVFQLVRSSGSEQQAVLRALWSSNDPNFNPDYAPVNLYGDARVTVDILSATKIDEDTMQVRIVKKLTPRGATAPQREGKFTATITYQFNPKIVDSEALVLENPFGFLVTGYRLTAENGEGGF